MATKKMLTYEDYAINGRLYEITKAVVPHRHINRLALTEYILTGSNDPNKYCLKNEIKIENIAGKELWCSKIYVDKDNKTMSLSCYPYKGEFILLLNYFEELIQDGYFTDDGIKAFEEIKENIKRIGAK